MIASAPPRRHNVEGSGTVAEVMIGTGIDAGPPTDRDRVVSLPNAPTIGPVEYMALGENLTKHSNHAAIRKATNSVFVAAMR